MGNVYAERFELTGLLGKGAFGSVYRAHDTELDRDVALKIVELTERSKDYVERFRREGEITAGLSHPGIVRVHTFGTSGEQAYLAYELVEGAQTLDDVLATVGPEEGARLLAECAEALGHAHARGVTHRDVKPSNILLAADGAVRVADFGLAAAQGLSKLTATGALLGTPLYMAPEQFSQQHKHLIGPASDVWALGVTLYQLLTGGVSPFDAPTLLELGAQVAHSQPPRPRTLRSGVPRSLEAVCFKALSKRPSERYPDGSAMADDLRRALAGETVTAGPSWQHHFSRRRLLIGALALPLVVLVAVAATFDPKVEAVVPEERPPVSEAPVEASPAKTIFKPKIGEKRRVMLGWLLQRDGEPSGPLRYEIDIDVEEAPQEIEGNKVISLSTMRGVMIELKGAGVKMGYDSKRAANPAHRGLRTLDQLMGNAWLCELDVSKGQVTQLQGMADSRAAILKDTPDLFGDAVSLIVDSLEERQLQEHLNAAFGVYPLDPTLENWDAEVVLVPSADVRLNCTIAMRRQGDLLWGELKSVRPSSSKGRVKGLQVQVKGRFDGTPRGVWIDTEFRCVDDVTGVTANTSWQLHYHLHGEERPAD